MNRALDDLRMSASLRFETPEPESRQGRRNARGVQLLEADGAISVQVHVHRITISLRG